MLRAAVSLGAILCCSASLAATGLADWTQVSSELFAAARRAGVDLPNNSMHCIGNYPNSCRWDAGNGVDILANNDGAGHLIRIEAGWNNSRPLSDAWSATTFQSLCSMIAALAAPRWGKAEVARAVARTMVIPPSPNDSVEREQALKGVKLYGSRNVPDRTLRDRPDEAFVQCGAVVVE